MRSRWREYVTHKSNFLYLVVQMIIKFVKEIHKIHTHTRRTHIYGTYDNGLGTGWRSFDEPTKQAKASMEGTWNHIKCVCVCVCSCGRKRPTQNCVTSNLCIVLFCLSDLCAHSVAQFICARTDSGMMNGEWRAARECCIESKRNDSIWILTHFLVCAKLKILEPEMKIKAIKSLHSVHCA